MPRLEDLVANGEALGLTGGVPDGLPVPTPSAITAEIAAAIAAQAATDTATYEALVDRTGASTGDVPTLQADGTLDFAAPTGGGGATNLAWDAATSKVASDTGTDATLTVVDVTNPGLMTVADKSKLDGIEAGADVTDAANVDAAGAVMNSDTSTAAMGFVIDEDNMASDSATKVPTQQSVKAHVAALSDTYVASADVRTIVQVTQAAYDLLTPDADTLYVIVG